MLPLVGRDPEIEALVGALAATRAGQGRAVVVVGEPGIGKTRLLAEARARAVADGFAIGAGTALQEAPPLWPLREVVRGLGGVLGWSDADVRSVLTARDGADAVEGALERAERLADRLAGARRPVAVLLDDLHAADDATLRTLEAAVRSTPANVAWVLASRAEPFPPALARIARAGVTLRPRRLVREEVDRLARSDGRSASLGRALWERAAGLPLFTVELIAEGRADGLPVSVRDLVAERLGRLSAAAVGMVLDAAVQGDAPTLPVLAELRGASDETVLGLLGEATAAGLLVDDGGLRLRFAHPLVREALEARLDPSARGRTHERLARVLSERARRAGSSEDQAIAAHWLAAVPLVPAVDAADVAVRTARRSIAEGAPARAVDLLVRARAVLDAAAAPASARFPTLMLLVDAAIAAGHRDTARDAADAAAECAQGPEDLARAALARGLSVQIASVDRALVGLLERVLEALPPGDSPLRARCMARLAAARMPIIDTQGSIRLATEAVAMARRVAGPADLLGTLASAGSAYAEHAPPALCREVNAEAANLARSRGDVLLGLRALSRVAVDHLELGQLADAQNAVRDYSLLAESARAPEHRWRGLLLRAMVAAARGAYAEALSLNAKALEIARQAGDEFGVATCFRQRHQHLTFAGTAADLRQLYDRLPSLEIAIDLDHNWTDIYAAAGFTWVGDDAGLRATLSRLPAEHPFLFFPTARAALAEVTFATRDVDRARHLARWVTEEEGFVTGGQLALSLVDVRTRPAGLVHVVLGDPARGLAILERARGAADAAGYAGLAARIGLDVAVAAIAAGEMTRARERLDDTRRRAEALGMPLLVAAADRVVFPAKGPASLAPRLVRAGDVWRVDIDGRTAAVRHTRGMELLARLLASPGVEIAASELEGVPDEAGNAGELLDADAVRAYRTRLKAVEAELIEAGDAGDTARSEALLDEKEALIAELSRGLGLGGRHRRAADVAERARVNVTRRLRDAIRRIGEVDPALGAQLDRAVRTGTTCVYREP